MRRRQRRLGHRKPMKRSKLIEERLEHPVSALGNHALEKGSRLPHRPNHISKTVLSIVKIGPLKEARPSQCRRGGRIHRLPSRSSKTVLSTVKKGPPFPFSGSDRRFYTTESSRREGRSRSWKTAWRATCCTNPLPDGSRMPAATPAFHR